MIYYNRHKPEDGPGSVCEYEIYRTGDPEPLKHLLTSALQVDVEVKKTRQVFWIRNVKINVDEVVGLGSFIEFEAQADRLGLQAARRRVAELMDILGVTSKDLVYKSYSDMIRAAYL